jgi:hypothetical protein
MHAGTVHEQSAATSTGFIRCTHYSGINLNDVGVLYESPCIIILRCSLVCLRTASGESIRMECQESNNQLKQIS